MRTIGFEIEFIILDHSVVDYLSSFSNWKLVEDDSCGWELVSPPLDLSLYSHLTNLSEVTDVLLSLYKERKIDLNHLCGLHIHFDVYDLSLSDIKKCILNWLYYEWHFLDIVPKYRLNNEWCLQYKQYIDTTDFYHTEFTSVMEMADYLQKGNKGYSMNIYSYNKFKTLEVRLFESVLDYNCIIKYVEELRRWRIIPD